MRRGAALVMLLAAANADAAQVRGVEVARHGQRFDIRMQAAISASPAKVFRALQDYSAMPRYNPDLREVRVEPTADPDRARLFTVIHTCVLFFCKTLHQEQIMTAAAWAGGGVLTATLVPSGSDFDQGYGRWVVYPCTGGSLTACMDVSLKLEPSFWVPPLIGSWLVEMKMREEARRTSEGLEHLARHLDSSG